MVATATTAIVVVAARKVSCDRPDARWGACGGYHAMRHVCVTSRGRSREHRVLPVTCPVTRSPLHSSLFSPSLYRSVSLFLALPAGGGPRLSFLVATTPFERARIRRRLFRASRLRSKCMFFLLPSRPSLLRLLFLLLSFHHHQHPPCTARSFHPPLPRG